VQREVAGAGLRDLWPGCGRGEGLTYPAEAPVKRIDYLYALGRAECRTARVITSEASDHRGVLFRLDRGR
jgi:endonuclease/exonuclease/phosphatase (EEP) superfamily protein YafD